MVTTEASFTYDTHRLFAHSYVLVSSRYTGKERDAESGLDYFGARYYASSMGRFMSPDPKMPNLSHLSNPQKWNKYAYTLNNPLSMIDPDGEDPIFVFRPIATSTSKAWRGTVANAKAHGNEMTIYNGKNATVQRMKDALATPDGHVVFDGHTVSLEGNVKAQSIHLADGDMGTLTTNSQAPTPVPDTIAAPTVGIFGCSSMDLSAQFQDPTFTGIMSGSNGETTIPMVDAISLTYANAIGSNESTGTATQAANKTLSTSTDAQDKDGDQVQTRNIPQPQKPTDPQ